MLRLAHIQQQQQEDTMVALNDVYMPPRTHEPVTYNDYVDDVMECSESASSSVPMVIVVRITPKKQPSAISLGEGLLDDDDDDEEESYLAVFTQEDDSSSESSEDSKREEEDYTVATYDEQQSMFTSPFAKQKAAIANVSPNSAEKEDYIPSAPKRYSSVDPNLECPPGFFESMNISDTMTPSVPRRMSSLDPSLDPSMVLAASIPPAFMESVSDTTVPMMNLSIPKRLSSLDPSLVSEAAAAAEAAAASTPPAFFDRSISDSTVPRMPRRIDSCDPVSRMSVVSIDNDDDDQTLVSIREDQQLEQQQRSFNLSSIRKELESKPLTAIPPSFVAASKAAEADRNNNKRSKIDWRNNSLVRYKNRSRSPRGIKNSIFTKNRPTATTSTSPRGIKNSLFSSKNSTTTTISKDQSPAAWKALHEKSIENAKARRLSNSKSLRKLYSKTNQDALQHLPPAFHHLLEQEQQNIVNAAALVASATSKSRRNLSKSPKGSFVKKQRDGSKKNLNDGGGSNTPPRLTLKRIRSISSLSTSSSIMSMVEHEDDTSIVQLYRFSSKSLLDDDELLSALVEE